MSDVYECLDHKIPCIVSRSLLGDSVANQIYSNSFPPEITKSPEYQNELKKLHQMEQEWEVFPSKDKRFVLLAPKAQKLHPKKEAQPFRKAFKRRARTDQALDCLSLLPKQDHLTIYLTGHGQREKVTLGMKIKTAKQFLTELQRTRQVDRLFLSSCYVGRVAKKALLPHLQVPTLISSLGSFREQRLIYGETESGEIYGRDISHVLANSKKAPPGSTLAKTKQVFREKQPRQLTKQWQQYHSGELRSLSSSLKLTEKKVNKLSSGRSELLQTSLVELSAEEVQPTLNLQAPFPPLLSMNGDGARHTLHHVQLTGGDTKEFFEATKKLYGKNEGDRGCINIRLLESETERLENVRISISPGNVTVEWNKREAKKS